MDYKYRTAEGTAQIGINGVNKGSHVGGAALVTRAEISVQSVNDDQNRIAVFITKGINSINYSHCGFLVQKLCWSVRDKERYFIKTYSMVKFPGSYSAGYS